MGCKYACVCGGNCLNCNEFEPEEYVGHAEDIYCETYGCKHSEEEITVDYYGNIIKGVKHENNSTSSN